MRSPARERDGTDAGPVIGQAKTLVATSPSGRTVRISGSADTTRGKIGAATMAGDVPSAWFTSVRAR